MEQVLMLISNTFMIQIIRSMQQKWIDICHISFIISIYCSLFIELFTIKSKMAEQFDIITGLPRRKYMSESRTSYRKSTDRQVDIFNNAKKNDRSERPNFLRLGTAKDHKKDFYKYESAVDFTPVNKLPPPKNRLVNSISTNYNIISHAKTS